MKVSVVIPVHNGERYLSQAIESVLAQTHRDLELLIVDDGSTDGSRAVAERFARRDARVRVLAQPNRGVAGAGNRGLEEARCEWVARLDADDVFLPGKLKRQVAFCAGTRSEDRRERWGLFHQPRGRFLVCERKARLRLPSMTGLVRENRPIYFVNSSTPDAP